VRLIPFSLAGPRLYIAWLGGWLVFDRPLAARTVSKRLRTLFGILGLAFQRPGEHLFGEDISDRDDHVLQLGELGAPRQSTRAIDSIDQTGRYAFDVRLHWLDSCGDFSLACHPWLLA
jgi:hypothetical protein